MNVLPSDDRAEVGVDRQRRERGEAQPAADDGMPIHGRRVVDVPDPRVVRGRVEVPGPVDSTYRVEVTAKGIDGQAPGHEVAELRAHEAPVEVVYRGRRESRYGLRLPHPAERQHRLCIGIGEERVQPTRQIGSDLELLQATADGRMANVDVVVRGERVADERYDGQRLPHGVISHAHARILELRVVTAVVDWLLPGQRGMAGVANVLGSDEGDVCADSEALEHSVVRRQESSLLV